MNLLERILPKQKAYTETRELLESALFSNEILSERLASLELSLEDEGWTRLASEASTEFSVDGLHRIAELSRIMYLKNPIINRGIELKRLYVWANGINIEAKNEDVNAVIQDFLDDNHNQAELTGHQAHGLKEIDLETDGNLFFVFFTDIKTGKVIIRSIPFAEITDIVCNPEDAKEPWYYHRQWTMTSSDGTVETTKIRDEYYPDWNKADPEKKLNGKTVNIDAPVYHVKVGGFASWKFGMSEVYAALDWAKAYKNFLENWATIAQALSRFVWRISDENMRKSTISAIKSKLNTTLGISSGEINPPPNTGAAYIGKYPLEPIKTAGVQASSEDGRRIMLMACAALGEPETFFGDADVGTLATAKSLDRPTELMMLDRQRLWMDIYRKILNYVLMANQRASGTIAGLAGIDEGGNLDWNDDIDSTLVIDFPPLMVSDVESQVRAIFQASQTQTLDAPTIARLLVVALGIEEGDEILNRLYPPNEPTAPAGSVTEALKALTEALKEIRK